MRREYCRGDCSLWNVQTCVLWLSVQVTYFGLRNGILIEKLDVPVCRRDQYTENVGGIKPCKYTFVFFHSQTESVWFLQTFYSNMSMACKNP